MHIIYIYTRVYIYNCSLTHMILVYYNTPYAYIYYIKYNTRKIYEEIIKKILKLTSWMWVIYLRL